MLYSAVVICEVLYFVVISKKAHQWIGNCPNNQTEIQML